MRPASRTVHRRAIALWPQKIRRLPSCQCSVLSRQSSGGTTEETGSRLGLVPAQAPNSARQPAPHSAPHCRRAGRRRGGQSQGGRTACERQSVRAGPHRGPARGKPLRKPLQKSVAPSLHCNGPTATPLRNAIPYRIAFCNGGACETFPQVWQIGLVALVFARQRAFGTVVGLLLIGCGRLRWLRGCG